MSPTLSDLNPFGRRNQPQTAPAATTDPSFAPSAAANAASAADMAANAAPDLNTIPAGAGANQPTLEPAQMPSLDQMVRPPAAPSNAATVDPSVSYAAGPQPGYPDPAAAFMSTSEPAADVLTLTVSEPTPAAPVEPASLTMPEASATPDTPTAPATPMSPVEQPPTTPAPTETVVTESVIPVSLPADSILAPDSKMPEIALEQTVEEVVEPAVSPTEPVTTPDTLVDTDVALSSSDAVIPEVQSDVQPAVSEVEPSSSGALGIGINGFGRIGRTSFRVWWERFRDSSEHKTTIKAINTSGSSEIDTWAHLLKYDSNYGVWPFDIKVKKLRSKDEVTDDKPELGTIVIDGHEIIITAQRDPAKIPWERYGVQTVIESTGVFTTQEKAVQHLKAPAGNNPEGAQKVILTAPAKGEGVETTVIGVKDVEAMKEYNVVSNGSCTTNCVAPVAQIMQSVFGVQKAMMTTIHAYTDDQNLQDNSHKDLRRARAAAQNIVPTSTGAAQTVAKVIPELQGIFDGLAIRVPVAVGSLSDMVFVTSRDVTVDEVNAAFESAAKEDRWQGILAVTSEPIVSSDIVGRSESSIVDLSLTQVIGGNLVKVIAWYDNEWGYCNRLVELVVEG